MLSLGLSLMEVMQGASFLLEPKKRITPDFCSRYILTCMKYTIGQLIVHHAPNVSEI
jgi:hypothetical protein